MSVVTNSEFYTYVSGNQRPKVIYWECDETGSCPLYLSGKCACKEYIFGSLRCPTAKKGFMIGPTKRAKSFADWVDRMREKYKRNAEGFDSKIAETAEYIFLPIPWLTSAENKIGDEIENEHFIKKELFTADYIEKIAKFRPRPWFGYDIIKDYPDKELPKFLQQLSEEFPELYRKWAEKYPETASKYENPSPIGRTAYVATLPDGCVIKDTKGTFVKEGEFLVCSDYRSVFLPFGAKTSECRIRITENMAVKIAEGMSVDKNTKYID